MYRLPRILAIVPLVLSFSGPLHASPARQVDWEALRALDVGERLAVPALAGLPQSKAFELERFDPYAAGARIVAVDERGTREVPRSTRLHFVARGGVRMALHMDADGGHVGGVAMVDGDMLEVRGAREASTLRWWLEPMPTRTPDDEPIDWQCSGSPHQDEATPDLAALLTSLAPPERAIAAATRQAVVAVDTDNEFMQLKFSDNTTNATNYLAALFTGMNVMYENAGGSGGLELRLLQGHTILRVSSTADPYSQSSPFDQLIEFGGHWRNNLGGVSRAFAMLLSGKSGNPNSASGIAWVVTAGNYCTSTGSGGQNFGHYSVTQVFRFAGSNASHDTRIVAHELGHNFGAFHTHCTAVNGSAPTGTGTIDQCFSGEVVGSNPGVPCYSGSVSCPGGGTGTIMSYCHFNPPSCGQAQLAFHPGHVTALNNRIASNFPGCITPVGTPDLIFADGFE